MKSEILIKKINFAILIFSFAFYLSIFNFNSYAQETNPTAQDQAAKEVIPETQGQTVKEASPATATQGQAAQEATPVVQEQTTKEVTPDTQAQTAQAPQEADKKEGKKIEEPIVVDGDTVEYSTDNKEVTASGNVVVNYKGTKLTCRKLTVNTETKDAQAEGDAKIEDSKGVIRGKKLTYNFQTKSGAIIEGDFRSEPYFGKAEKLEKVSDNEFVALNGYMSTCNFDKPHYRLQSKKIDFFPNDKVQTEGDGFYIGDAPIIYIPHYNQSLKEGERRVMHVQVSPGHRKEWGYYVLTAWRYNLNEYLNGRLYLDYRNELGPAEGFGLNYHTGNKFGTGDFKFYYTDEKQTDPTLTFYDRLQRYLVRWRHRWEIDKDTSFISEFYKINDEKRKKMDGEVSFLKDYFYREFEKDTEPLSYAQFHHSFQYSTIDVLIQKRSNHWFNQVDKLPQATYSLPSLRLGNTPFYFENSTSAASFNKKAETAPVTTDDVNVNRLDTYNKLLLPVKVSFINFTPFVANRETFYDRGADGKTLPIRTVFSGGADVSTKLYRVFDVKSNFLGMQIDGLRHIITPSVGYTYNHTPTIRADRLKQIDAVDRISAGSSLALELSNKLQTKRNGQSVDLVDFRVSTIYDLFQVDPFTDEKAKGHFEDIFFDLKFLPYSWLRLDADATYNSSKGYFPTGNYDINFHLAKERSIGFGQRYHYKGGNEIVSSLNWRINPKWRFSLYQRRNIGNATDIKAGLREQEYTISRDLHCWTFDFTWNMSKDAGDSVWFIFRLKAFPETEFGFNQTYHEPKAGSDTNP